MPVYTPVPTKDRRALHRGDKGDDVKAYQRMLKRTLKKLGLVSVNAQNGYYGDGTLTDTLALQARAKIKKDGVVGPATWTLVNPQMKAYERYLLRKKAPPEASAGDKIAHQMEVMYALGMDYYSQIRPSAVTIVAWKKRDDCSGSMLLARHLAVGTPYDGTGNTGTIWVNWIRVTVPARGDAALYGHDGTTTHVQCVTDITDISNPTSVGFGSAPGNKYPVHTRGDFMGYRRGA